MKKLFLVFMFLFLVVSPAYGNSHHANNILTAEATVTSGDVIPVSNPHIGGGEDLITKAEQMANDLHRAASRLIVPITLMVLILGGLIGIFLPLFRRLVIFAVIGLVLVLWAPMLVNSVVNWVN